MPSEIFALITNARKQHLPFYVSDSLSKTTLFQRPKSLNSRNNVFLFRRPVLVKIALNALYEKGTHTANSDAVHVSPLSSNFPNACASCSLLFEEYRRLVEYMSTSDFNHVQSMLEGHWIFVAMKIVRHLRKVESFDRSFMF